MARYFCHQCNMETEPESDLTCPRCHSGFVELLNTGGATAAAPPPPSSMGPTDLLSQIQRMFGPPARQEAASQFTDDDDTSVQDATQSQQSQPSPLDRTQHSLRHQHRHIAGRRTNQPRITQRDDGRVLISLDLGSDGFGSTGSPPGHQRQNLQDPLSLLLSQFIPALGGAGLLTVPNMHMRANLGDYAWGPGGLDAIITQLLNMDSSGPPPADREKIESLPSVRITPQQVAARVQCSVCITDYKEDEEVKILPCRLHYFHEECILPWLEIHGTCPVCRIDLNGQDTTVNEYDANIGEAINNMDQDTAQVSQRSTTNSDETVSSTAETSTPSVRDSATGLVEDDLE